MERVLLVEDEYAHAELIRRAFNKQADLYELHVASSLAEARRVIQNVRPDVAFVDFYLPDGSGAELLSESEDERAFPVVILTSYGNEQIAVEALKAGALDYVVKSPAVFAEMPSVARRILREWRHIVERQRRRAERELRESEEKFRKILETASEGVMLVDHAGTIKLINRYVEEIFGYERDELLDQPVEVLLPPDVRDVHVTFRQSYQEYPTPHLMGEGRELLGLRRDGTTFPVEVSLAPVVVSGQQMIMCLVIDITVRRQLEEQRLYARTLEIELEKEREIIELRENFTSMLSHEFRTPLTIILSSISILQTYLEKLPREKVSELLDRASNQIHRMVAMLDDVLAVSRGNANRIEFHPESIEVSPFCQRIIQNIELIDQNQHSFEFDASDAPQRFIGDVLLLENCFSNLLSNAAKYSPPRTRITFEVRSANQGEHVLFSVSDQGIGIPPEEQPRIFQPFHRAANARHIQGTGLGLAIVRQYVERHGGRIWFESREGRGTRFNVELPLRLNTMVDGEGGVVPPPPHFSKI